MPAQHELHPNQILGWQRQLETRATGGFDVDTTDSEPVDLAPRHPKINQEDLALDFLKRAHR